LHQPITPKIPVYGLPSVPGEQAHCNLGTPIEISPSKPLAGGRDNLYQFSILGTIVETVYRTGEQPGMSLLHSPFTGRL
jgi:hypothetical protein